MEENVLIIIITTTLTIRCIEVAEQVFMQQFYKSHYMKHNLYALFFIVTIFLCCDTETRQSGQNAGSVNKFDETSPVNDTTPKVTGIGGIFFFSEKPGELKEWYGKYLGLEMDDYGSVFEFRNANRPDEINYLRWSLFRKESSYFHPSGKDFMINYRVQNIEKLVDNLRAGGVIILDSIAAYDYGKFVHILDPEGNKIELWEPVDSVLTSLGGKTTK